MNFQDSIPTWNVSSSSSYNDAKLMGVFKSEDSRALLHTISVSKVMWKFPVSHFSQFVIMASSFLELSSNRIAFVGSKLGGKYRKITSLKLKQLFLFNKFF
ncbi:TPA: hypothetical protein AB5E63_003420, partial [Vibrio cholerae]